MCRLIAIYSLERLAGLHLLFHWPTCPSEMHLTFNANGLPAFQLLLQSTYAFNSLLCPRRRPVSLHPDANPVFDHIVDLSPLSLSSHVSATHEAETGTWYISQMPSKSPWEKNKIDWHQLVLLVEFKGEPLSQKSWKQKQQLKQMEKNKYFNMFKPLSTKSFSRATRIQWATEI